MRILDRYIIRQFLLNFVILTISVIGMVILVDVILNVDELLGAARSVQGQFGDHLALALIWVTYEYYHPMVLLLYCFMSGLMASAAVGFTLTHLSRSGEVVAVLASGVSLFRLALPLLVAGFLLGLVTLPIQEFVLPPMAYKLERSRNDMAAKGYSTFRLGFTADSHHALLSAWQFDPLHEELTNLTILVRDERGLAVQRITASQGNWDAGRQGWVLTGGRVLARQSGGDISAPRQTAAIDFYPTNLDPESIMANHDALFPRLLGIRQLTKLLSNPLCDAPAIQQIIHGRFAQLVVNLLVLLMTLPFFLVRVPGNLMIRGGLAALVSISAWGLTLVVGQMGGIWEPVSAANWSAPVATLINALGPLLARPAVSAWLPVVLYLPLSAWMLMRVKT